jgi:phage gp46-like protein
MRDIALVWNPQSGTADLALNATANDLLTDSGLTTSIIISLFTDRQADPGDAIPDGSTDPRGWWGDTAFLQPGDVAKYPIGSKLWLLDRALQTPETLTRATTYAKQALQWLIDDGVAGSVEATATFPRLGWIELFITIDQAGSLSTFNFAWANS